MGDGGSGDSLVLWETGGRPVRWGCGAARWEGWAGRRSLLLSVWREPWIDLGQACTAPGEWALGAQPPGSTKEATVVEPERDSGQAASRRQCGRKGSWGRQKRHPALGCVSPKPPHPTGGLLEHLQLSNCGCFISTLQRVALMVLMGLFGAY